MRLLMSLVLVTATVIPALGDDVPFAAPPPSQSGQSSSYSASLGDIMGAMQWRHIKLWYAGEADDWDLAGYELEQINDTFVQAAMLYRNIPVNYIAAAAKPLLMLREAVAAKDGAKFAHGFADLTAACNGCHQAAKIGFIAIQTPTSSPFSDQKF
jgi:hypothetical protein